MDGSILRLDEICAVIADAMRQANAAPHEISWLDDTGRAALSYRIAADTPHSWRAIPHSALYRRYRYRVSEIVFSFPCCVSTRKQDGNPQTVLRLRLPAWWRRWGRQPPCRRIEIEVSAQGTRVQFLPGDLMQLPRKGTDWIVLLTPEQQAMLTRSADTDPADSAAQDDTATSATESKRKRVAAGVGLMSRWAALWQRRRG